ncbi:hypothetical protein [Desulfatibacillum aliphaticivorans]|uniref:hypothetical protein n=1 Tax=Desulfatibacillum aliphaticivorans TaxID=218208 RepID=UPI0003FAEB41|nr:hypothetical protein [Desulfatibacillum aliphaticivorans]
MDLRTRIQNLFKEAEIYRQQGLYGEAKKKYLIVANFLKKNDNITNREQLLDAITKKISAIDKDIMELDDVASPEEMASSNVQDLVKGFFSTSTSQNKNKGAVAFKGAVALAQLRQFERALVEFERLVPNESVRVPAAKNVLKCYMALGTPDKGISQYDSWLRDDMFTDDQIESVRVFFEDLLKNKGLSVSMERRRQDAAATPPAAPRSASAPPAMDQPAAAAPSAEDTSALMEAAEAAAEEAMDDDPIEICSLEITYDAGPEKGQTVEIEVDQQIGNKLTMVIPGKNKEYVDNLGIGQRLDDLQFFSHFIMFRGAGVVLSKSQINSGVNKGDYSLVLRMETQTN